MGHLLGLVADRTFHESGLLISALVKYVHENGPGPGFYAIASDDQHRLLPRTASSLERLEFWASQVSKLQDYYGRRTFLSVRSRWIAAAWSAYGTGFW